MRKIIILVVILSGYYMADAQQQKSETISKTIDELTVKWDSEAVKLEKYEGLSKYCKDRTYRIEMVRLLNKIHHYDTVLYQTVKQKYTNDSNEEAKATLDDIEHVEEKYTTKNFLDFLHKECNKFNDVEKNYGAQGGKKYLKEVSILEKEASKYIDAITVRIDLIDEHVHHLKGL